MNRTELETIINDQSMIKKIICYVLRRLRNTGLVSSRVSLTSWGEVPL